MVSVHMPSRCSLGRRDIGIRSFSACSTHRPVQPGSVRDLERQGQAATERHRIKTSQATASLVQKPDGRQVVVIGYPASVVPPTQQVAATSTLQMSLRTVHAPSPQVAKVVAPSRARSGSVGLARGACRTSNLA